MRFGSFLLSLVDIYILLIIIRAVFSWFAPNPGNQFYRTLVVLTEPVLAPIRRIIPLPGIDISPIIAILLIQIVARALIIRLFPV
jgi:YggT family protein